MVSDITRQALIEVIDGLNEDQAVQLLSLAWSMFSADDSDRLQNYDPAKDPTVALFDGSPDLSERAEEILRERSHPQYGWTQRKDE